MCVFQSALWLPLFAHSSTESSAPVLKALTRCRSAPLWVYRVNNNLTIRKHRSYRPSVHQSHFSRYENRSWTIFFKGRRQRERERESRGRSRNGTIWMYLRTTREGKLVHFRINPDKLQICNYTGFRACLLQIHSGISGYVSLRVRV